MPVHVGHRIDERDRPLIVLRKQRRSLGNIRLAEPAPT
jgi:hypothetical protein